jgi:hypothetical protein
MTETYKPRKKCPVAHAISDPIEFLALDWYECDLLSDINIERKESYLNQVHNKSYTIFIFGVTSQGHSVCLKVKNYLPYFYVQIPDEFTPTQAEDFLNAFDASHCDDYDGNDLDAYNEAIAKRDFKFTENFKLNARYYKDAASIDKSELTQKKVFWTFMNEQKFTFARMAFKSKLGYQFMERAFKSPLKLNITGHPNAVKYNLFESDLEPVLRFMHDKKIKPSSWIHLDANKFKTETRQSKCQINISCDWSDVQPLEKAEIPPLLIASFDIEADSSHGDFPIARKDCKKLANQLVITWIRDQRIIEKKQYEPAYSTLIKSKTTQGTNQESICQPIIYIDKKYVDHDSQILQQITPIIQQLQDEQNQEQARLADDANLNGTDALILQPSKLLTYYREVAKYIHAKNNLAQHNKYFDNRIKKALQFPQFATVDDEVEYIYLKKPTNAKMLDRKSVV